MQQTVSAVALGSFDGLHLGHMAVLRVLREQAPAQKLLPRILLFQNHPQEHLTGKVHYALQTQEDRDCMLQQLGISPWYLPFPEIRELSPERFVHELLQEKLGAQLLCCGYNYHFGKDGAGDVALLQRLCDAAGIRLRVAPRVDYKGEPVSSSRIRESLEQGRAHEANKMLGRVFSYHAPVIDGDHRGRLLGYPTINQILPEKLIVPQPGVYASRVCLEGKWFRGVTNLGCRPTFAGQDFRSETHILDFSGDLYGQNITVGLLAFLRREKKFSGERELKVQIACDALLAREITSAETPNGATGI